MATLTIRMEDDVYEALKDAAAAAGKSAEAWARETLMEAAHGPVVRRRYAYRAVGPGPAWAMVQRLSDDPQRTITNRGELDAQQAMVLEQARKLIARNEPGDRDAAVALLRQKFDIVFEVGLVPEQEEGRIRRDRRLR